MPTPDHLMLHTVDVRRGTTGLSPTRAARETWTTVIEAQRCRVNLTGGDRRQRDPGQKTTVQATGFFPLGTDIRVHDELVYLGQRLQVTSVQDQWGNHIKVGLRQFDE